MGKFMGTRDDMEAAGKYLVAAIGREKQDIAEARKRLRAKKAELGRIENEVENFSTVIKGLEEALLILKRTESSRVKRDNHE